MEIVIKEQKSIIDNLNLELDHINKEVRQLKQTHQNEISILQKDKIVIINAKNKLQKENEEINITKIKITIENAAQDCEIEKLRNIIKQTQKETDICHGFHCKRCTKRFPNIQIIRTHLINYHEIIPNEINTVIKIEEET